MRMISINQSIHQPINYQSINPRPATSRVNLQTFSPAKSHPRFTREIQLKIHPRTVIQIFTRETQKIIHPRTQTPHASIHLAISFG